MKTPMNELIDKAIAYSRELSTEGYLYESMAVDHIIDLAESLLEKEKELPSKEIKDYKLSDMVSGYKTICKPDANFEKYYSKGFTECWEWLRRITK
jgi:hypothetical protein